MAHENASARKMVKVATAFLGLISCVMSCPSARSQVAGAGLSGTIRDISGAVISGSRVSIKNLGTDVVRTVTTNSDGIFSAPNLPPGAYQVTVKSSGFETLVQSNLTLTVGAQQELRLTMKIGEISQTVTVSQRPPTIDLASAMISSTVGSTTVRELPLNGRDWTQLATLEPGVNTVRTQASTSSATANRTNRGFGNQLTDSGHSPYENSYRMNGININDYSNGAPGSAIGANLGVDAIQEFSIVTTNYTAEYGRTSGAVINAVTRSGTNKFYGTAFGFLRDSHLDSKNYFDSKTKPIAPFHRYQFGGAGGGPIVRDKTFIFGAYEGVRQAQSSTSAVVVPSPAARNGLLCSLCATPNQLPFVAGSTNSNGVSLTVVPYLGFWPLAPAGSPFSTNGDTQSFSTNGVVNLKENYATVRLDHHFSESDTLSATWMYDRGPYTEPDPLLNVLSSLLSERQLYGLEESHLFSAALVNTARFGFNRSKGYSGGVVGAITPVAGDTTLGIRPGIAAPIIQGTGLTATASVGSATQNFLVSNSFQFYDDLFLTKGKHSLKFGFALEPIQFNNLTHQRQNGVYTFSGTTGVAGITALQAFLQDTPASVTELSPGTGFEEGSRQTSLGFYVHDSWQALPSLNINIGLRYEPVTLPTEAHGLYGSLVNLTDPTVTRVPTLWAKNPSLKNFEPRVGLSWDPFGTQKTSIHAGFGVFDILPLPWMYNQTLPSSVPFTALASASGLVQGDFPVVKSKQILTSSALAVVHIPQAPPTTYSMNWNLNIQREITSALSGTIGYVGSRSVHMPDLVDNMNYALPMATPAGYLYPIGSDPKLNPNVGNIRGRLWDDDAYYSSLQAGLTEKLDHGIMFQASYTWAKCLDTGSHIVFNDPYQNSLPDYNYFDKHTTRGLCDFSIAQNGTVSFIYAPTLDKASGLESAVVNGWSIGGLLAVQSGSPFTPVMNGDPWNRASGDTNVDYVDRLPGCNAINSAWKSNGKGYLNLNCFTPPTAPASMASECDPGSFSSNPNPAPSGQVYCANLVGNVGRNQLVGPGLLNLDMSVFKSVHFSDRFGTQLRVEMFNILNHPNFLPPLNNEALFNTNGAVMTNSSQIDTTSVPSRQIQFGMKVMF